ncbi:synaptotagmin-2-like [Lytechinus pictus]|uniref:synaptotagmin-2-like n=1 Tax=Lytechinus pictus TaxID=7653 RepID=UPI0030B9E1CD
MAEQEVSQAAVPNESAAGPPAPTEGAADGGGGGGGAGGALANMGNNLKNKVGDLVDKIPLPTWAVIAIAIVAGLILLCCCFCICKKCCCKKRKKKEGKKGLKGAVDLKSVQMLGNSYKEKRIFLYAICSVITHILYLGHFTLSVHF